MADGGSSGVAARMRFARATSMLGGVDSRGEEGDSSADEEAGRPLWGSWAASLSGGLPERKKRVRKSFA